jgi:hypothetical protein
MILSAAEAISAPQFLFVALGAQLSQVDGVE